MKLYEKETKQLLADYGLATPEQEGDRYVVKAQVLAKERAEHGGIEFADSLDEAQEIAETMEGTTVNDHRVEDVLIEAMVEHDAEYYVAFLYDTNGRQPVLLFNREGGSGIEDRGAERLPLATETHEWRFREFLEQCGIPSSELMPLGKTLANAHRCFTESDARMLEINPLCRTEDGYVVLDGRIELDDDAEYRHEWEYPARSEFGREKTDRERRVEAIDEGDHRGVAGKYTELDGDIAMLLAGGGASLTNMDALIQYGGEPANYTEYGGNPPTEKVYRLSKEVLSKPGLRGCWHVGGTANNTDVYRTMQGFCQALRELEIDFPIVVRRDGPNADAAFDLLRETRAELDLEMKLFRNDTPMSATAATLMEMVA
ncbi:MAG: ATP citrate lyase citrate-binding domain-containing protein [Halobacteriales archaeon]